LLALACGAALLVLWPLGVSPHAADPVPAPDLSVDSVRQRLQAAGYAVGAPAAWDEHALLIEARAADGVRVVRAFVYRDAQAAAVAHRRAQAHQAGSSAGVLPDSDDAGPQLLSGFGASTWRRNVALVQSSPGTFAELMPAEADCTDLAPPPAPDLSRPVYRVDPAVVGLLDTPG
jgi:hypothetical protein